MNLSEQLLGWTISCRFYIAVMSLSRAFQVMPVQDILTLRIALVTFFEFETKLPVDFFPSSLTFLQLGLSTVLFCADWLLDWRSGALVGLTTEHLSS